MGNSNSRGQKNNQPRSPDQAVQQFQLEWMEQLPAVEGVKVASVGKKDSN